MVVKLGLKFLGMVRCAYLTGSGWNMNCKRELITPAVASTAPLTITKYNKTLDEENIKFWNNIYLALFVTEYV